MNAKLSRRTFLKSAAFATLASALPAAINSRSVIAQVTQSPQLLNSGAYRFKVGNFQMISMSDGVFAIPAAVFAGNATPDQLNQVLCEGFQSNMLSADCNVLFVDTGSKKVLIDTGSGTLNGPTVGKLLNNMAIAQIDPSDIDTIIITHAHGDHIGGVTDTSGALVFSNAEYYVADAEWRFWTDRNVSLPNMLMDDEAAKQQFIEVAQKQLRALGDRLTRFAVNQEIFPGFYAIHAPGHTAGHVAIRITSENATLVHAADAVHTHTINLWNPEWHPVFDAEPELASETRQNLLSNIAEERQLMFAYHFPFPGLGHIRPRSGGGFDWEPVNWQFEA